MKKPLILILCIALAAGCSKENPKTSSTPGSKASETGSPLRIVVMDPLALPLSCECVKGFAQRRYEALAEYLEAALDRPVEVTFSEYLGETLRRHGRDVHLLIGKASVVQDDADEAKLRLRPAALLADREGSATVQGLFVVRGDSRIRSLDDLKGRRVLFGPPEEVEKHGAALRALAVRGIALDEPVPTIAGANLAALEVIEKKADAAIIASYERLLLEGCSVVEKGDLRVVGETDAVPFVMVFLTDEVSSTDESRLMRALFDAKDNAELMSALESRDGFVPLDSPASQAEPWSDWRGPNRDGISRYVPAALSREPVFAWRAGMKSVALSGIAATARQAIVADKSEAKDRDVWMSLDAATGQPGWTLSYSASGEMEYSNSPRANPVVRGRRAWLLGALGDLHCVDLDDGAIVWKRHLARDFGATVPAWGYCSTPLLVDDRLVVNPGAKDASIVALSARIGEVVWKTPGNPAAYSSFIVGTFGGKRQIVGYDAVSLGGWDVETGKRLWMMTPENEGDFNVGTPVDVGGRVLVATENNGTRLYAFDDDGTIIEEPVARFDELAPDTSTPVVIDGLLFGCSGGRLFCLDVDNDLAKLWEFKDDAFLDYASLVAGNGRVLITTVEAELILIRPDRAKCEIVSRVKPFEQGAEIWSHPAIVGDRLYLRTQNETACVLLRNP